MNAKQMLLDYASKKNTHAGLTNEQFIGKASTEGVRLANTPEGDIVAAYVKREGKTIIVTETITVDAPEGKKTTTSEVFRAEL